MIYDLEETVGAASPVDLGDDAELVRRGEVDEGDVAVGGHLGEARPVGLGPGIALREGVVARNSGKKLVRSKLLHYHSYQEMRFWSKERLLITVIITLASTYTLTCCKLLRNIYSHIDRK